MQVWLNGRILPAHEATLSPFDRGFLFGDGVYELVRFFNGVGVGIDAHVARLERSLGLTRIGGFDAASFPALCSELLAANELRDAAVYLQVTRGVQLPRAHMPAPGLAPTVFAYASPCGSIDELATLHAGTAITRPDPRWSRCEIKTTSLLGNILALLDAQDARADEVLLTRHGLVGEGAYSNVFALIAGTLVTTPVDDDPPILHGVTRWQLLEEAQRAGIPTAVRPMTLDELAAASEVFIAASRRLVTPILSVDGSPVGTGRIGPVTQRAFALLAARIRRECGLPPG
jgi:D-alanine transaminase